MEDYTCDDTTVLWSKYDVTEEGFLSYVCGSAFVYLLDMGVHKGYRRKQSFCES
jgi:hypothetical protein